MSQLHPRRRHATALETVSYDHCLAAHRSQPTPTSLFLGRSIFSSSTLLDSSPTVLFYHPVQQFPTSPEADIRSDSTTLQLTRLRSSIGTVPTPVMDIGSEADKRWSSSFNTNLVQWFRGRQTPGCIPIPPSNNPRHLPSKVVSLASATVHPRLANPSISKRNSRFIRLAAALPP